MIYTGYFAKCKSDNGVAICLYKPEWWKGECFKDLAPTERILQWWKQSPQDSKAQAIYKKLYYRDVLNHLDVHDVARALQDKILLCYEKPGDFCHRHIVAEWLRNNGYECEEADQDIYMLSELLGNKLKIIIDK